MSNPVDRPGQFRALITSYGLQESKDGAVGVAVKAKLTQWFGLIPEECPYPQWQEWERYEMEAEGVLWVIKKNGEPNELAVKSLVAHAGWDGNLESVVNQTWQPMPCQVSIAKEEYKGQVRFRINFVNDNDRDPMGLGSVDAEKVKTLQARFGSQLRAIAGNAKRNTAPANGAPPAPPAPSNVRPVMATAFGAPEHDLPTPPSGRGDDGIPF